MNNWKLVENDRVIRRIFVLQDFKEALRFVDKIGELAEHHDHHPEIRIFDYKKVEISLTTHSADAITEKDIALAKEIDKLSA
ncbi:MAG: 4a-hydroxytetrahydrobiopterin dehydratase [Candidatus Colwellbacteria bacterium]